MGRTKAGSSKAIEARGYGAQNAFGLRISRSYIASKSFWSTTCSPSTRLIDVTTNAHKMILSVEIVKRGVVCHVELIEDWETNFLQNQEKEPHLGDRTISPEFTKHPIQLAGKGRHNRARYAL